MTAFKVMPDRVQEPCPTEPFHAFVSPDGTIWTEFHRCGLSYLLRFPGFADFDVSADGTEVASHPSPGTDRFTVEHLYINQVLPLALSRQGRLAFHASAVTVPGGAVAFLGRSGVGKSTLAAQFATSGASFLTDDGLLMLESPDGYMVSPNHPSIRLWDDSQKALLDLGLARAPSLSFTSKARVLAGDGLPFCQEPQRLLAAYVLDEQISVADVVIGRLSLAASLLAWIRNSFLLDVEDPVLLARHFQNATDVAAAIPTYHLHYPRHYHRLPDVQRSILEHVS